MPRAREPVAAAVQVGDTLTCAETGETFPATTDPPNFILKSFRRKTEILSFQGLLKRNLRDQQDHVGPFPVYLSRDGRTVHNRLGAKLGDVKHESTKEGAAGKRTAVRVVDSFGRWWSGSTEGPGSILNLRPTRPPKDVQAQLDRAAHWAQVKQAVDHFENTVIAYHSNATTDRYHRWQNARRALLALVNVPGEA